MGIPIYYGVEQRMMRVKLRYSSEKEVVDLTTGKMVTVDGSSSPAEVESSAGQRGADLQAPMPHPSEPEPVADEVDPSGEQASRSTDDGAPS